MNPIVKQYLRSLHAAGVTHADGGFGDLHFEADDSARSSAQSEKTATPKKTATAPVELVSQGKPAYDVQLPAQDPPVDRTTSHGNDVTGNDVTGNDAYAKLPATTLPERENSLQLLQQQVTDCEKCEELARTRTQTVFGAGNPQARLVFLGEAPGGDEDKQGVPFVGAAGQKLNDIITGGMQISRDDVYIMNVLRCRPPGNRNPSEDEAANCRGFLDRQLEIIRPEFICCLGGVAATRLLNSRLTIGRLRGKWHDYRGAKVIATYHPSYLLRNPSARQYVWEDIKMLMREMGLPIRGE